MLHNYTCKLSTQTIIAPDKEHSHINLLLQIRVAIATNSTSEAMNIRSAFKEYFMTNEGRV